MLVLPPQSRSPRLRYWTLEGRWGFWEGDIGLQDREGPHKSQNSSSLTAALCRYPICWPPLCRCLSVDLLEEDSEVFKMLQENREGRGAPRQSSSFRLLQEALEAEERGERRESTPLWLPGACFNFYFSYF